MLTSGVKDTREAAETQVETTIAGGELLRLDDGGAQKLLCVSIARFIEGPLRGTHGVVPFGAVRGGCAWLMSQEDGGGEDGHGSLRTGHPLRLARPRSSIVD